MAAVTGLREGANPWLLRFGEGSPVEAVVLREGDPANPDHCERFATEVAALEVAAHHQLPAARLIAIDLDGDEAGVLAVLTTVLAGHSRIPLVASTSRLRRVGGHCGRIAGGPAHTSGRVPATDPLDGGCGLCRTTSHEGNHRAARGG